MDTFLKKNASPFDDQLYCEAKGLEELKKRCSILKMPKVMEVSEKALRLTKINSCPFNQDGLQKLGKGLAQLHAARGKTFGLDHDNYIGLAPQINSESPNWGEFFVKNRLSIQIDFILDGNYQREFRALLYNNADKVTELLNSHGPAPSPVHGDLWSGNVLYDGANAWLIDPAFYWGDREVDLAMTEMFGGFGSSFYEAYNKELPLARGHEERKIIYNLYHYLNHFNLFGISYLKQVRDGLGFIDAL